MGVTGDKKSGSLTQTSPCVFQVHSEAQVGRADGALLSII